MKAKQENYSFTLNYHKHPEIGGVGHISLVGKSDNEEVKISVHPDSGLSIWTPLHVASGCVFPMKAVNVNEHREGDSPVHATYDITKQMRHPQAAFDEMKKLDKSIATGTTGYSLLPSYFTKSLHVLLSPQSNIADLFLGYKMMDREIIDNEMGKFGVTNCSESVYGILSKGGIESKPTTTFSFIRPVEFNEFAQSICDANESDMSQNSITSFSNNVNELSVSASPMTFFSTERHTYRSHAPQKSMTSLPAISNIHELNTSTFFATRINRAEADESSLVQLGSMQLGIKTTIEE